MSSELIGLIILLGFVDGKRLVQKTSKAISAILERFCARKAPWYVASIRSASRSAWAMFFSAKVNHCFHGQWAKSWYSKQVHAKNCLFFSDTVDINNSCVKPYDACCLFDNAWGCASQQTVSKWCKYQRKVQKCCKTQALGQKHKGPKGSWFLHILKSTRCSACMNRNIS